MPTMRTAMAAMPQGSAPPWSHSPKIAMPASDMSTSWPPAGQGHVRLMPRTGRSAADRTRRRRWLVTGQEGYAQVQRASRRRRTSRDDGHG